jgi:hypothetical protein
MVAMVIGVQAFDTVAVHSGGAPVFPLKPLFDGVANHPSEPEYWWLYALLISSMIPSLLNLAIGGASFLRGVPGLPSVLLGFLPAGKAVPPFDRAWIALVLTVQTFLVRGRPRRRCSGAARHRHHRLCAAMAGPTSL